MGIYTAFADLLSYPRAGLLALVDTCLAELPVKTPNDEPRRALLAFRKAAERLGVLHLEEEYTAAFDLDPACSLYVGHHIFGENARRGFFMWRLLEMYREAGLSGVNDEPPDHLPLVLRYLDAHAPGTASTELLSDALVPALGRVAAALEKTDHPYTPVVRALLAHLEAAAAGQGAPV